MYSPEEMTDFMVANFLYDEKMWVGALLDDEAKDRYNAYVKRKQTLTYTFDNELSELIETVNGNIKSLFKPNDGHGGQLPVVIGCYEQRAGLETLALLDYFVGYFDKYNDEYRDDYLWSKLRMKCKKLLPFMEFDKNKIKTIIKAKAEAHI